MNDTKDPTPQKLIDQLRATVEMKDHLLQMVSHEMRTPLVSITNFSSTMLDRWGAIDDDDKQRYLGMINGQAQRLSRLVDDLLAVARLESGRLRTARERIGLREVADETAAELAVDSDGLTVSIDAGLAAYADRDHVKQILVNYVTNAIKYGKAPIAISAEGSGEDTVRLWVEDHGSGVSPEFEPHLFEKFAQARPEQQSRGSGLGLAIVEGLAHAQDGVAWYERRDEGTRFGVTLPSG